jgi:uncharacterized protein YceH (UPF0502 family)
MHSIDHPAGRQEGGKGGGSRALRPLDANERRVLGVLIEKAKTTPDQYPLSLNAVVTGCNQKSNRDPVMHLDEESAARALTSLRHAGAVAEVFGSGKIPRYRHLAYEWLDVGKEELAILGELLLRGEQSEGDLRGRASRMDPIPDLESLRTHLDALASRNLIVWLSPPGRGRMLTHGLLPEEKLEKVRAQVGLSAPLAAPSGAAEAPGDPGTDATVADGGIRAGGHSRSSSGQAAESLAARVDRLESELAEVRDRLAKLEQALGVA